ncbi:outer membrane beta-barrel protein [Mucilaginibacter sp. P19]|uniref:Outer membrane protein beta-barrel domain-containing protein n=2 Tax=Mucilaginibacter TaxID=423349 RepID=A0A1G7NQM5_9SPHI|nr:outer membrane beta-barrel protein [Mucilaginibacter gossypii]SDF76217.1 Outer membrane protein beta-barrel domain-containing protein [Mucilaginibacter gossypii]
MRVCKASFLLLPGLLLMTLHVNAQTEKFTSRLYFPGGVGINIPSGDEQVSMKRGSVLNTAVEYRPAYMNTVFFRFNYDALNNKYKSKAGEVPTNVTEGKLSASFFLLGVGYRRKLNRLGIYALLQSGYNSSGYNNTSVNSNGITVSSVSTKHPAVKISAGVEYYIVPHFALVFEPAYYHLYKAKSPYILNPDYVSYSIGFTTTLF